MNCSAAFTANMHDKQAVQSLRFVCLQATATVATLHGSLLIMEVLWDPQHCPTRRNILYVMSCLM